MTFSKVLASWLAAVLIVMFSASFAAAAQGFTYVNKDQLKSELSKPDVIILDVRTQHDSDTSSLKIQGAIHESPSEVSQWINKYPKDKTLVLYCA
jgi:predicted sulfurtransferase